MSLASFYGTSEWGNLWGIKGPKYGAAGHRGHDLTAAANTPIPLLRGGLCVAIKRSSIIGDYFVIKVAEDDFDGYAHVKNVTLKVGKTYSAAHIAGQVAGYGDYHGTAWLGPHLHITNGPSITSVTMGTTRNPANVIRAVFGANSAPLTPTNVTTTPTQTPAKEALDMGSPVVIEIVEGANKGAQICVGPGLFKHYTDGKHATATARALGQPNDRPLGFNATEAEWIMDSFLIPKEHRAFNGHTWQVLDDIKYLLSQKK